MAKMIDMKEEQREQVPMKQSLSESIILKKYLGYTKEEVLTKRNVA